VSYNVQIAARDRNTSLFPNAQVCSGGPSHIPIQCIPGSLSVDANQPRKKLTTFFHPAPSLRTSGAIVPLPYMPLWNYTSSNALNLFYLIGSGSDNNNTTTTTTTTNNNNNNKLIL
jgi:hypothetical protein